MNQIRPEWQGTAQHLEAKDLSRWLVHLTRSEADLISILKSGRIEARIPYGAGRGYAVARDRHLSVCLTETPLHELGRMTFRRPWGVVFDKERLRAKFNAQPVWYVSDPSPEWKAWQAAMQDAARLADSPIWALTPFIETVRSRGGRSPNDWRWEREWRVQGDLEFDLDDVAMIVADTAGAPGFFDQISVGLPWVSSEDSTVRWSGGFTAGWDEEIDSMLERFYAQFLSADRAGLIWDREEQRYFCMAEVLDTWDAMEEAFGHVVPELGHVIERGLSRTSTMWCRIFDLSNVHE